jgi:hypothetical protein
VDPNKIPAEAGLSLKYPPSPSRHFRRGCSLSEARHARPRQTRRRWSAVNEVPTQALDSGDTFSPARIVGPPFRAGSRSSKHTNATAPPFDSTSICWLDRAWTWPSVGTRRRASETLHVDSSSSSLKKVQVNTPTFTARSLFLRNRELGLLEHRNDDRATEAA